MYNSPAHVDEDSINDGNAIVVSLVLGGWDPLVQELLNGLNRLELGVNFCAAISFAILSVGRGLAGFALD